MIRIADKCDIDIIAELRTEQQIEDWNFTSSDKDYSAYADKFFRLTKDYLSENLNSNIFFVIMLIDEIPVAMCAIQMINSLPQITACEVLNAKAGEVVSVYTRKEYRGKGYQQKLLRVLLEFAKKQGFNELVLTANTSDAQHIYRKLGFSYISNKYYYKF